MPLYDYLCRDGHVTEARRGYEVGAIPCALCGRRARRQAVYVEQYTRTESGGMQGRQGGLGMPESVERVARQSEEAAKDLPGWPTGPRLR